MQKFHRSIEYNSSHGLDPSRFSWQDAGKNFNSNRIYTGFMKAFSFALVLALFCSCYCVAETNKKDETGWITIPAGAKPAFMGIHGGTMPVSLLVSKDGSAFFSFVGQTGNDFLEALRFSRLSKFTVPNHQSAAPALFAGNATSMLPVFPGQTGKPEDLFKDFSLFGFSQTPVSVEGSPVLPTAITSTKKYRNFYLPGSLTIRKK